MGRIDYRRLDLSGSIQRSAEGASLSLHLDGRSWDIPLGFPHRSSLLAGLVWYRPQVVEQLLRPLVAAALPPSSGRKASSKDVVWLRRFVLDVQPDLAALDWETLLRRAAPHELSGVAIVRVSSVWPRVAERPMTLPLRLLHVDPVGPTITEIVATLLYRFTKIEQGDAVQVAVTTIGALREPARHNGWPTAEVLHFDYLPQPAAAPRAGAGLKPALGSAAWVCRLAEVNQTRLVVVRAASATGGRLRQLAHEVVEGGGPAVLVVEDVPDAFFRPFYEALIHDFPIDAALMTALSAGSPARVMLAGGAGREELLRASSIGSALLKLGKAWHSGPAGPAGVMPMRRGGGLGDLVLPSVDTDAGSQLAAQFEALKQEWEHKYHFEWRESEGLIPMSRRLRSLREAAGAAAPVTPEEDDGVPAPARHLHYSLWRSGPQDQPEEVTNVDARLRLGSPVQLELRIAAGTGRLHIVDDAAILEEQVHYEAGETGRWLEIGLTPLDFEVHGAAQQSFWLPRRGDSEALRFTVSPRRLGVARLRWTLYQGNEVLRSYRLAAVVVDGEEHGAPAEVRQALAEALEVTLDEVNSRGFLARLEYSLAPEIDTVIEREEPVLSLVANDHDGRTVITLKSGEVFEVAEPNGGPQTVRAGRQALAEIEAPPIEDVPPERWRYAFGADNSGTPEQLALALQTLAAHGAELYNQLVPGDSEQKNRLREALMKSPGKIHVAHVLLKKVLPWGLVYDREYDEVPGADAQGRPIAHAVCMAALNGNFDDVQCGRHERCELHPTHVEARLSQDGSVLTEASVVCPLHFWGFRHVIELPPQQAKPGSTQRPLATSVRAGAQVQMLRALNSKLDLTADHESQLDALVNTSIRPARWKTTAYERNAVRDALADLTLDVLYFYCHAEGGEAFNAAVPRLTFGEPPQPLTPRHLAGSAWPNRPLVLLNGCGTVAYSPDALSPFIDTLVRDRGAAGVLGTEIPVWEALATEMARLFLAAFVAGQPAGEALRNARLALLKKNNPLGLAYTLYAAAELRLDP